MTIKIGILGGGQLGMMMIEEKKDLDIEIYVLDPNPNASCAKLADHFVVGDFKNYDDVYKLGKKVDILTIEIEHVNTEALQDLEMEGKKIYPNPDVIKTIQDKGKQKLWLDEHEIPTSGFFVTETPKDNMYEVPFVQKARTGGYDGKGVQIVKDRKDEWKVPSVIEELIDIDREISVIVARNPSGEVKTYPAVDMEFDPDANLVTLLRSPTEISEGVENTAREIAEDIATKMGHVGVLAVEMFLTKDGVLLVNEIAPRPHNSGHQTIEGNKTSQFHQHLLAILGKPLGSTDIIKPSVMVNLLGSEGCEGKAVYAGLDEAEKIEGVFVHLYRKEKTKPFRKMGHITCLGDTIEEAVEKAHMVQNMIRVVA